MKSLFKKIIVALLTLECRLILAKYHPTIIAVTGSVGKTSAKDAIYTVLKAATHPSRSVRRNQKSFNSELGVPLTIIGRDNAWNNPFAWLSILLSGLEIILLKTDYPKTLILEVGADHPGDIRRIVKWLKPHVAVVTKISKVPVHVEFFPSPESVAAEKGELIKGLRKGGLAILSADDSIVMGLKSEAEVAHAQVFTFGLDAVADVTAAELETIYTTSPYGSDVPEGIRLQIKYKDAIFPLALHHVLGMQHVYPVLVAIAVGIARGVDVATAVKTLHDHKAPQGRMNILAGVNGSTLIDDTYNASPDAMQLALHELAALKIGAHGRKIAVLGDMMELGKHSVSEHAKVGECAAQTADILVTVGQRSKGIAQAALGKMMNPAQVHSFERAKDAAEFLARQVRAGDIVLIKGSQSVRAERITKVLLADQSKASELLVRHDPEWLAKP